MALPKLEAPTFTLNVPSTDKQVKYRPYLVKEERNLMIAMESKDPKAMISTLLDLINTCTFGELDVKKLTTFDLEYVFTRLRVASSGEISKVVTSCKHCEADMEVELNLNDVEVVGEVKTASERKFNITDSIGMVLKYPTVFDLLKEGNVGDLNDYDATLETIIASIETIFDAENVYPADQHSHEELESFVDSLSKSQMEKMQPFFEEQPVVQYKKPHVCKSCKQESEVKLEGLQNFF